MSRTLHAHSHPSQTSPEVPASSEAGLKRCEAGKLWLLPTLNLRCREELPEHSQCPSLRLPEQTLPGHMYSLRLGREQPFFEIFECFCSPIQEGRVIN